MNIQLFICTGILAVIIYTAYAAIFNEIEDVKEKLSDLEYDIKRLERDKDGTSQN